MSELDRFFARVDRSIEAVRKSNAELRRLLEEQARRRY